MMNIDQHHQLQQQHQQQMLQQQAQAQAQAQANNNNNNNRQQPQPQQLTLQLLLFFPRQVSFNVSDHYQILEIVGEGAYGIVCSAIHKPSQQKVAIKKLNHLKEVCYVYVHYEN